MAIRKQIRKQIIFSNPGGRAETYIESRSLERRIIEQTPTLRCRDKVLPKKNAEPEQQRLSPQCVLPGTELIK